MNKKDLHNDINSGFKVPKDYFENFEDNFLDEMKLRDSINDSGFDVPKDYFESFDDKLFEKIDIENQPQKVIQLSSKKIIYYLSGVAAAVLLLFTFGLNFIDNDKDDVSVELVQTYFDDSDMNAYELAELLDDSDFLEEDFSIVETDFEEDNLEEYLLENSDIENIIIQ